MSNLGSRRPASNAQLRELERILQRQPGSRFFASLVEAYVAEGRAEEALGLAERGVAQHPDFVRGHVAHALALDALGRLADVPPALAPLENNAVALADGYVAVARARLARGDRDGARDAASAALSVSAGHREARGVLEELGVAPVAAPAIAPGRAAPLEDGPLLQDTRTLPPWAGIALDPSSLPTFRGAPSYAESASVPLDHKPKPQSSRAAHAHDPPPMPPSEDTVPEVYIPPPAPEGDFDELDLPAPSDAGDAGELPASAPVQLDTAPTPTARPEPSQPIARLHPPGAGGSVVASTRPGSPVERTEVVRDVPPADARAPRKPRSTGLVVALVAVLGVLGGAGAGAFVYRDEIAKAVRGEGGDDDGADGDSTAMAASRDGDGKKARGDGDGDGDGGGDGKTSSKKPGKDGTGAAEGTASAGAAAATGTVTADAGDAKPPADAIGPADAKAIGALLAAGRPGTALLRLDAAGAAADPGLRGLALAAAGRSEEALALLAKARAKSPGDVPLAVAAMSALLARSDAAGARDALAGMPAKARAWADGALALHEGNLKRAGKVLRKAERGAAGEPALVRAVALARVRHLLATGAAERAVDVAEKGLAALPDDADLLANHALAMALADRADDAASSARALLARKPAVESATALVAAGEALLSTGDAAGAVGAADTAFKGSHGDLGAAVLLGRAAAAAGDLDRSVEAWRAAVATAPASAAALAGLANALLAKGDAKGAAEPAAKAFELAPADVGAAIAHAKALAAGGDADAGAVVLRSVTKAAKGTALEPDLQLALGRIHAARGKKGLKKAIAAYGKAIALRETAEAHVLLGQALEAGGKATRKKAIAEYRLAVEVDAAYAPAHLALGLVLAKGKKPPAEARASLEKYLELAPTGAGVAAAKAELAKLPK